MKIATTTNQNLPLNFLTKTLTLVALTSLSTHTFALDLPAQIHEKMNTLSLDADRFSLVVTPLQGNQLPATKMDKVIENLTKQRDQADSDAQFNYVNDRLTKLQATLDTPALTPLAGISKYADVARTPASTMKLIPTFVALDTLGKDFRWQTDVFYQGFQVGDTLYGDLIIKGSGDPKLTHEKVENLLYKVQAFGISHIHGNILLDDAVFQKVSKDPAQFDNEPLRPYNASPNGILMNFTTISIDSYPLYNNQDEPTNQSLLRYTPRLADVSLPTHIGTRSDSCSSSISRSLDPVWKLGAKKTKTETKDVLSYGTNLPSDCGEHTFYIAYPNPMGYAQHLVKAKWLKLGNTLTGHVKPLNRQSKNTSVGFNSLLPIASELSYPLSQQIYDINHHSNNVMTEQVMLSIPLYQHNKQLSLFTPVKSDYPLALTTIDNWWTKTLTSPPPHMTNGSGLCRECHVTANNLSELLNQAYQHPDFTVYVNSLGVAGVSGTIETHRQRKPSSSAIGRAWIKTGTLGNVTAMAGYIKGKSGQEYSVVGLINLKKGTQNANKYRPVLDEMIDWVAQH